MFERVYIPVTPVMVSVTPAWAVVPAVVKVPCADPRAPVADQFQVKARAAFGTNSVASEAAAAKATGKRIAKVIN